MGLGVGGGGAMGGGGGGAMGGGGGGEGLVEAKTFRHRT